jgi:hypothetical protein
VFCGPQNVCDCGPYTETYGPHTADQQCPVGLSVSSPTVDARGGCALCKAHGACVVGVLPACGPHEPGRAGRTPSVSVGRLCGAHRTPPVNHTPAVGLTQRTASPRIRRWPATLRPTSHLRSTTQAPRTCVSGGLAVGQLCEAHEAPPAALRPGPESDGRGSHRRRALPLAASGWLVWLFTAACAAW